VGLLLALIGIPAVVIALIGEQETRIVVFGYLYRLMGTLEKNHKG